MKNNKGQVLLIIVMLLATVVTIVMAVMFKSTTNTQLTKLEQESNKALVAAEAGLEEAMRKNAGPYTLTDLGLTNYPGINLDTSNVNVTTEEATTFITSSVPTDGQYTFYLVGYDTQNQTIGTDYFSGNITIYFNSEAGTCDHSPRNAPALEAVFVKNDNTLTKKLIEPCNGNSGENYISSLIDNIGTTTPSDPIEGVTFSYRADLGTIPTNTTLIIVRTLFAGTKIGLEGNSNLKPQRRMLTAQVKAYSGVEKKVQLFQSYPQLPADFFVTSF